MSANPHVCWYIMLIIYLVLLSIFTYTRLSRIIQLVRRRVEYYKDFKKLQTIYIFKYIISILFNSIVIPIANNLLEVICEIYIVWQRSLCSDKTALAYLHINGINVKIFSQCNCWWAIKCIHSFIYSYIGNC